MKDEERRCKSSSEKERSYNFLLPPSSFWNLRARSVAENRRNANHRCTHFLHRDSVTNPKPHLSLQSKPHSTLRIRHSFPLRGIIRHSSFVIRPSPAPCPPTASTS